MIDRVMSALLKATERVTPTKPADKIQQRPFILAQGLAGETVGEIHRARQRQDAAAPDMPAADRQEPLTYVPLPLRSQVYEDTRFYWKLKDFSVKTGEDGGAKIIFSVRTETLGYLWFTLTAQPGKLLSVQCITEHSAAAEVFRAGSASLQEELAQAGYPSVIVSCRFQPGIRGMADIDPDFAAAETHALLNVQV